MRILTGMSGYAYKEWVGSFYPEGTRPDQMLARYGERFPTVEINNTFYRMPSERVLLDWAAQVAEGFTFTIKASRRITHMHRLKDVGEILAYLIRNVAVLGARRGPLLFQLPPTFPKDLPRLEAFLALLPEGWRTAFEFRHPSWQDESVQAALRARGAALVAAEGEGEAVLAATTDWGYARLHRSGYLPADLRAWAERIRAMPWRECYVYFKHEEDIAGPSIATEFALLAEAGQA